MLQYVEYVSPIGKLLLTEEAGCLTKILIGVDAPENALLAPEDPALKMAMDALDVYFRGEIPETEGIPVRLEGSEFSRQVWQILRKIPHGQVRTYGSIAREMAAITGRKMSAQAVGQAVGRNPISILIPCHRVVGTRGKLTGYAWGVEKKQWLLNHEKWNGII